MILRKQNQIKFVKVERPRQREKRVRKSGDREMMIIYSLTSYRQKKFTSLCCSSIKIFRRHPAVPRKMKEYDWRVVTILAPTSKTIQLNFVFYFYGTLKTISIKKNNSIKLLSLSLSWCLSAAERRNIISSGTVCQLFVRFFL